MDDGTNTFGAVELSNREIIASARVVSGDGVDAEGTHPFLVLVQSPSVGLGLQFCYGAHLPSHGGANEATTKTKQQNTVTTVLENSTSNTYTQTHTHTHTHTHTLCRQKSHV